MIDDYDYRAAKSFRFIQRAASSSPRKKGTFFRRASSARTSRTSSMSAHILDENVDRSWMDPSMVSSMDSSMDSTDDKTCADDRERRDARASKRPSPSSLADETETENENAPSGDSGGDGCRSVFAR